MLVIGAMTRPLSTGKKSVNLASPGPRTSRIRRDPPPKLNEIVVRERDERDRWVVVVGILTFALAIFVIVLAFSNYAGWSPRDYTVQM